METVEELTPIHFGAVWYLNIQRGKFKKGDIITVKGLRVIMNQKSVIIAQELKLGNKALRFRDANGQPNWTAREHLS